jgi:hypothetical protein
MKVEKKKTTKIDPSQPRATHQTHNLGYETIVTL